MRLKKKKLYAQRNPTHACPRCFFSFSSIFFTSRVCVCCGLFFHSWRKKNVSSETWTGKNCNNIYTGKNAFMLKDIRSAPNCWKAAKQRVETQKQQPKYSHNKNSYECVWVKKNSLPNCLCWNYCCCYTQCTCICSTTENVKIQRINITKQVCLPCVFYIARKKTWFAFKLGVLVVEAWKRHFRSKASTILVWLNRGEEKKKTIHFLLEELSDDVESYWST